MTSLPSVGGAPIAFVDSNGNQYSIPLSFVTFTSITGAPTVSTWPGWTGPAGPDQADVTAWLAYLTGQQLLAAATQPLPPAAFTMTARDAGSSGNDITISFGTVTPNTATPASTTVDVTVSTSQVYAGLTPASISTVLGAVPLGGTQPGLAYVSTPFTSLPTAATAISFASNLALIKHPNGSVRARRRTMASKRPAKSKALLTGAPLMLDVAGSGGGVLSPTHDAASEAADAALLQAAISSVDSGAGTFTLMLSWTKSQTAIALSSLAATFAYLVTVTPPTGGFVYAPAANSSITLLGGTDPATIAPNSAGATVPPG
jgi:hypothetical protein